MEIKYTFLGLLIYLTMVLYLLAFAATVSGRQRLGQRLFGLGFLVAAAALGRRWYEVRHVPLQSMFEVFLSMGVMIYPLSRLCRRILEVGGEAADMLIGAILLGPAGLVFPAELLKLPAALQSWLFAPHVSVYLIAYVLMAKAAVEACCQLKATTGDAAEQVADHEERTYKLISLGFPLLTLGLIMGSVWGKLSWGDYWGWDPKELWSLASWLVYVGYFHFRYMFGKKHARINSAGAILGITVIVITLLWVNLAPRIFPGLHNYAG